jgi:predicted PurR-regulated permease PerM
VVLAGSLAVLVKPFERKLQRVIKSKSLSAFVTTIVALIICMAPFVFLGTKVISEAITIYENISEGGTTGMLQRVGQFLGPDVPFLSRLTEASENFYAYSEKVLGWIIQNSGNIFSGALDFGMNILIVIFAMFYFLRDGSDLKKYIASIVPLPKKDLEYIFVKMNTSVRSTLKGTIIVGFVQGLFVGIGFWIFGFPQPAFWGAVGVIASFLPVVGTGIVTIPAGLYAIANGDLVGGLGMAIWGGVIAGSIDNLIRPKLIEKEGMDIHPFLIFLSVMGGLVFFGPMGFLFGPLVLGLLIALLNIYPSFVKSGTKK